MKKFYTILLSFTYLLLAWPAANSYAQCVDGSNPNPVAFDTTIYFGTGVTATQVKFPKFNPQNGMLGCVKLIVTITGVIDTVAMQNLSPNAQSATFDYNRYDEMTGPGLLSPLSNTFTKHYGTYTLTPFDGNWTSGTDYKSIPRDTVLKQVMVRTLTDSTEISQFYGQDSMLYNYNISVGTSANITGGSSSILVLTSALVNFRFEYCVCPKAALPMNFKNFTVTETTAQTADLHWDALNDDGNYVYDVEISRDGKRFSTAGMVQRKYTSNPSYYYKHVLDNNAYGRYYFRIRQHWLGGYVRYSDVRLVDFVNPFFASTSLYPNPSNGEVGIKFINVKAGKMLVQVSNAQGQQVLSKEIMVAETDLKVVGSLTKGMYWVKITDVVTDASCVNQLLIQ